MRSMKYLCSACALLIPAMSQAAVVDIGEYTAEPGTTITIPVVVDVPGDIAAAAFTLNYDASVLTLDAVESEFFDTFSNQWNGLSPVPVPMPPSIVTVDGTTYDQPILDNTGGGQSMLVGVRVQTGAVSGTMFSLTFTVSPGAADGDYTLALSPSVLNNTAMGYDAAGEEVTPLVGIGAGATYPAVSCTFDDGMLTVESGAVFVDSDGDGIDDTWEYHYYATDLNRFSANGDYDFDGYTDLQEYLNMINSPDGLDEFGQEWSPLAKNAPDQTGYTMSEDEFWLQILPAIQQGAKK